MPNESKTTETPAYIGKPVIDANLVLEGGAMRGQFTAGVLDFLMDKGVVCKRVIGTSAGALNGFNYASGAVARTCYITLKYADDWRYISAVSLFTTGNVYNRDYAFNVIPNKLERFDFMAFNNSPIELVSVSSDIEAGEAVYHVHKDALEDMPYLIASSSMPLLSRIVEVDGLKLLDGGACDSVPIDYALKTDVSKQIVILTQDATFEKQPDSAYPAEAVRYAKFPNYLKRLKDRHLEYNAVYNRVKRMQAMGEIFLMQPEKPVTISKTEKDREKLLDLYLQGVEVAAKSWPALCRYLEIDE